MSAPRLAAEARELLGEVHGPVAIVAPAARRLAAALAGLVAPANDADRPAAALVALLWTPIDVAARQAVLAGLARRLPVGGRLVVVDHNQPRGWGGRLWAALRMALRGFGPARARYPVARELAALGYRVERLRLADGERIQLVVAQRGP